MKHVAGISKKLPASAQTTNNKSLNTNLCSFLAGLLGVPSTVIPGCYTKTSTKS